MSFLQSFSKNTVVTLVDGATVAIDVALGSHFQLTLAGNRTLANPTNDTATKQIWLAIRQDAVGSRTLAFDTNWISSDSAAVINPTAESVSILYAVARDFGSGIKWYYTVQHSEELSGGGAPTGAAGGDLSGTYPNPVVSKLTETSGPTSLTVGTVADGDVLVRSGSTLVGSNKLGLITVTQAVDLDTLESDTLANKTKVDFLTVTQAVDLDILESDTVTNNAKVTNATHTGDVTGSTALTIAPDAVTLAKMAGGTAGNLISYDAAGDPVAVATGDALQVLTSNGVGLPPSFQEVVGGISSATTTGTSPTYVLTPSPALVAYAAGNRYQVTFHAGTTVASTINVSGLGVKSLKQYDTDGNKVDAALYTGQISDIIYDGVDFVLLDQVPSVTGTGTTKLVTGATNVSTTTINTELTLGGFVFDPSDYSESQTISFQAQALLSTTDVAGTLELRLYDMGPGTGSFTPVLRSVLVLGQANANKTIILSQALTIGSSPGVDGDEIYLYERAYELRAYLSANDTPNAQVTWAGFHIHGNSINSPVVVTGMTNYSTQVQTTEVVLGGFLFDPTVHGTATAISYQAQIELNTTDAAGSLEIRLYDMGSGLSSFAPVLRSTLAAGFANADYTYVATQALTAETSPGVDIDEVHNELRAYELRAYLSTSDVATAKLTWAGLVVSGSGGGSSGAGIVAATTTGTSPTYVLTPTPALTAYAAGNRYQVTFHAANTIDATLNVSGLGAQALKQYTASGAKQYARLPANFTSDVIYDGTDFIVLTPAPDKAIRTSALSAASRWRIAFSASNDWWTPTWCDSLNLWICVFAGGGGGAGWSASGGNWTSVAATASSPWIATAWSPTQEIAVAMGGGLVMHTFTGKTWIAGTPATAENIQACIWVPALGRFIAVGYTGVGNRAQYSSDGLTWLAGNTTGADKGWLDVTYSPQLNRLVATGNSITSSDVMISDDGGETWTLSTTPVTGLAWASVAWIDHMQLFVAFGSGGNNMTSPDGVTWTLQPVIPSLNDFNHVRYAAETGIAVAVANTSTITGERIFCSVDGLTWHPTYVENSTDFRRCGWSPEQGRWLATGSAGTYRIQGNF